MIVSWPLDAITGTSLRATYNFSSDPESSLDTARAYEIDSVFRFFPRERLKARKAQPGKSQSDKSVLNQELY
jgi:hypothetical protein